MSWDPWAQLLRVPLLHKRGRSNRKGTAGHVLGHRRLRQEDRKPLPFWRMSSSVSGLFTHQNPLKTALGGGLSWLEHCPVHQKVCGFDPQSGHIFRLVVPSPVRERVGGSQSKFLSPVNVYLILCLFLSLPLSLKSINSLAVVAQWIDCGPVNQSCWFNSQSGHMLGWQARSSARGMREAATHWCFSPSLSPSLPLSVKINK